MPENHDARLQIVTIVGARPQFIKAAAVSRVLRARPGIREILVHTGQHYDPGMSQVFFDELGLSEPDHHLGVGSDEHGAQTARMIEGIERILLDRRPDWVLVYGDTNSTLAGAIAAAKLNVPIAHVEAGLRSFNRRMPEEINRVLTDHAADLLFAPTAAAVENLQREGLAGERVRLVGDVMYDAALHFATLAEARTGQLDRLGIAAGQYVLATIHRAENTDDPVRLEAIVGALVELGRQMDVVLPLHPRTRRALESAGRLETLNGGLHIIEPVGYLDMVNLERHARLIATDSGGVQKEAFFHRVPCATLRDETEWVELVELGWNSLVPPSSRKDVLEGLRAALEPANRGTPPEDLYGGGHAAEAITVAMEGSR